jgi:valyl-tRNA synthetase
MKVLYDALYKILLLLAPINPMISEEIYLKMFKPYIKLEDIKSIHLQDWPKFNETEIDIELEEQMNFTRDLIEHLRALKVENNIRLRWPNKALIIEPKEGMPEIIFPEVIKNLGNVKQLSVVKSIKSSEKLLKAETKFCNIYLDTSLDEKLLAERVVNELIRNIQFSRKKNSYKVGESIALSFGTSADYLKDYIEQNKENIVEKVTAKSFEVETNDLKAEDNKIFGTLNICPNIECSASLRDKLVAKLKKQNDVNCPYCNSKLSEDSIKTITFNFKRE